MHKSKHIRPSLLLFDNSVVGGLSYIVTFCEWDSDIYSMKTEHHNKSNFIETPVKVLFFDIEKQLTIVVSLFCQKM